MAEEAKTDAASEAPAPAPPATEVVFNTDLDAKLANVGLTPGQMQKLKADGAATEADLALLTFDDVKNITGCGTTTARKYVQAFTAAPAPAAEPTPAVSGAPTAALSMDILPVVPEDASFLELLKVGGVLKIQPVDVLAAMKAAIASRAGLYELPDILLDKMETFAKEQEEPVGESFYTLQKMITSRAYGDVLSVIGVGGNFISEKRKKETLRLLDDRLWSALHDFNTLLTGWSEAWQKGMANPGMMMTALASLTRGPGMMMPPGMMAPPDTAGLRDEAEAVINRINSVFAGTGIPVARALAYDATRIKGILEEPTLPAAVGAANRDQMLKSLGVNVSADYVRLERNLTRYALAIMELPKVSAGNEEYAYLGAMLTLGTAIDWDKLTTGVTATPSRRTPSRKAGTDEEEGRPATGSGFRDGGVNDER